MPTGTRRGLRAGLGLLLLAASWAMPSAGAQREIQLDLGYEAENLVPPEALLGEWRAVISRNGKPQPVSLSIKDVTPGKTSGKMIFASPRRCYIDLEYGGPDRGRHIFYIIRFTNCFEYGRSDFIALSQVPGEELAASAAEDIEAKRIKTAEILNKFDLGTRTAKPVEAEASHAGAAVPGDEDPVAAPPKVLDRIVYAINLADEIQDTAILNRQ